ncbi:MAG: hypothetical protein DMG06_18625 [Acidobacteria bacterium]|nr:MAG: hypothetical protein DMG06_18625 [Acidobacteriota bacterium]
MPNRATLCQNSQQNRFLSPKVLGGYLPTEQNLFRATVSGYQEVQAKVIPEYCFFACNNKANYYLNLHCEAPSSCQDDQDEIRK